MDSGLFPALRTAAHLYAKLEHDRDRMRREPWDPYPAMDFFTSAEHIGEWPGADPGFDHQHHGGVGCLLVACHLAIGAKHFDVGQSNRPITGHVDAAGGFQRGAFDPVAFDTGGLTATHEAIGDLPPRTVRTTVLADEVLAFWRDRVAR